MRSTYTRILLWMFGTLLISIIAFAAISWVMSRTIRRDDPMSRSLTLQLDMMRRAYESGGVESLVRQMEQVEEFFPGQRFLTDGSGRDLITGEDRSDQIRHAPRPGIFPRFLSPGQAIVYPSADFRYYYIIRTPWRPSMWTVLPYFLWILLAIAVLAWVFTRNLVRPLRALRDTLDRFGKGDLSARTNSRRRDEFGELSRTFDDMAARIETLLTAERRLLQDVSHELRTPLSRLGFAIELARRAPDRDASLDRIRKEVERLNQLVGQLLEVTRAEGDPGSRTLELFSLDGLLGEIAADAGWEAELRHVRILTRIDTRLAVRGDRELLRRAIENVLRNAIRYAPESSTIRIHLDANEQGAAIRVQDEGPGVAEENLHQIFQPFFREDSSRNGATGGLGLGLAIACRAIHLHHGKVRAANTKPGLMVEIELPVAA
jgi:signal transduction histidine kinase